MISGSLAARHRRPRSAVGVVACGWAVFLAMLALFWMGPLGSDDSLYWQEAGGWLRHFPYVGPNHWALRHTLVIPLAISRAVLGGGEMALALPSILAGLAVIAVVGVWVSHAAGRAAGLLAVVLVATNVTLVRLSSTASVDFVEMAFLLGMLALLQGAVEHGPTFGRMLGAGALAGLALTSRETTVFAVAAVGLLFLVGYGFHRLWYCVGALGFAAVSVTEMLFYRVMTGEWLYRWTIALHHDDTIDRWLPQGAAVPLIHPLIDPVTMLLLNHTFGVVFLVGVPVSVWAARQALSESERVLFVLAGTMSAVWALLAAGLWHTLPLIPRYFELPAVGVSMLASVGVVKLARAGRVRRAAVCGVLLVGANVLASAVDNRNFMFGEHALVAMAGQYDAPIHTDVETQRRAELMLQWRGLESRVVVTPPGLGDLYFYNPPRLEGGAPPEGWEVVARAAPAPGALEHVADWLPVRLPAWLRTRLGPGHPGVVLYRTR